jgi:hypothetical protein
MNSSESFKLTTSKILAWAGAYFEKHGRWPNSRKRENPGSEGKSWRAIDNALKCGLYGLPAGSSLSQFLKEHGKVKRDKLTTSEILAWADAYLEKRGRWPNSREGEIPDSQGMTWRAIDEALQRGRYGLPGRSSLAQLLKEHGKVEKGKTRRDAFDPGGKHKPIVEKFLAALAQGSTQREAAKISEARYSDLTRWQSTSVTFADAVKEAKAKTKKLNPEAFCVLPIEGAWLGNGIFHGKNKRIYLNIRFLKATHPFSSINQGLWYEWIKVQCTELDPTVNFGRIRAFKAPALPGESKEQTVWDKEDATRIATRRSDSSTRRTTHRPGTFLSDEIWDDQEHGVCAPTKYLATLLKRNRSWFYLWFDREHPALPPNVNAAKPRYCDLPPRNHLQGAHLCRFASIHDFQRIDEWERGQQRVTHPAPAGRLTRGELAQTIGLRLCNMKEQIAFSSVLRHFRGQNPNAWDRRKMPSGGVREAYASPFYYDGPAFRVWFQKELANVKESTRTEGEPSIKEVARYLGQHRPSKRVQKRLLKAVRFLQFVLTHGFFGKVEFRRFLLSPPVGQSLGPGAPVSSTNLRDWAKEAGVGWRDVLKAKKIVGAEHKGIGPNSTALCFLPSPALVLADADTVPRSATANGRVVTMTDLAHSEGARSGQQSAGPVDRGSQVAPEDPKASTSTAAETAQIDKRSERYHGFAKKPYRTGKPANAEREVVVEFCYVEYKIKGRKAKEVAEESLSRYGQRYGAKNGSSVKEFAKEWSTRFHPPLPLDRPTASRAFGHLSLVQPPGA